MLAHEQHGTRRKACHLQRDAAQRGSRGTARTARAEHEEPCLAANRFFDNCGRRPTLRALAAQDLHTASLGAFDQVVRLDCAGGGNRICEQENRKLHRLLPLQQCLCETQALIRPLSAIRRLVQDKWRFQSLALDPLLGRCDVQRRTRVNASGGATQPTRSECNFRR